MEFLLLDDRANLKLAIIRKLEQKYSFSERKDVLCEQLAISQYLLDRSIMEINDDLSRFGLIEEMEVGDRSNEIVLFQGVQISSSIVEERYLRDSLEFNLLKTIFFHQFTSIKKYGEKHGMSRTVVYKIVDHIRQELSQYGIRLSKNFQLIGNEMSIRQYFTMLYYRIYKDSDELYNQSDIVLVNDLFAGLRYSCEDVNTFYLFRHYLLVMLERVRRKPGYLLPEEVKNDSFDETGAIYQVIYNWAKDSLSGTNKEKLAEIHGIVNNLAVYRTELCDLTKEGFLTYSQQLKELFFSQVSLSGLEETFYQEVNPIIYQHKFVTPFIDITLRIMDLEFFQERYPLVFDVCLQFVTQLTDKAFAFSKKSLFFDLLLVLSKLYDRENEKNTINIYVNFTQGEKYNQFIKAQIKIFDSFSIHFHSVIRPDTDLIISDYLPKTLFSAQSLIWLAPPRASDWQNFGNEIIRINKGLQRSKNRG